MNIENSETEITNIWCVLIPRFNMLSVTSLLEPVRIANYLAPNPHYAIRYCSFDGELITSSSGLSIHCETPPEKLGRKEIVMVFGSWGSEHYQNPKALSWLRLQARLGSKICGIEIGAYLLARSGLLAGKSATTHWSYLSGFQEQFPGIDAVEQLYTDTGNVMTCSGGTAGIDMMLHIIGQGKAAPLVGEISDQMMHYPLRDAQAAQRLTHGRGTEKLPSAVRIAIKAIETNVSEPLSVPEIAELTGLSQRQLERQFGKAVGCSIVQFGLLLRLQHARTLLITTELGVHEVSVASGFNSLSHFAFAFKKCFGKRPSDYRQAWSEQESEPHWPGTLARFLDAIEARRRAKIQSSHGVP